MSGIDSGGIYTHVRAEGTKEISVFFSQFRYDSKTALKELKPYKITLALKIF